MSKIVLEVDEKNIDVVMTVLLNLKSGLIKNIESEKGMSAKTQMSTGKYLSKSDFKDKLKGQKNL